MLLLAAPVFARADDPQPEPVAVEGEAAPGIGRGDRGVVDPEEQLGPVLPARGAFPRRVLDQFQRMQVRVAEIHGANPAGVRVPGRERLRACGDRYGPGPQRELIGPVDIGNDDCEMLEPEIIAARGGWDWAAGFLRQHDPLAAEAQDRGGVLRGATVLPCKADRLVKGNGAVERCDRDRDMADRIDCRLPEGERRGKQ
jgi:hypothetical protein